MIWLTWRRYRWLLAVAVVLLVALGLWMADLVHWFDTASQGTQCRYKDGVHVAFCSGPRGFVSLPAQASIIDVILLALPCLFGAAFGAPLVASELEHHTNRLMWTQGISRLRWFFSKWGGLAVIAVGLVALLTLETQWWTGHVFEVYSLNFSPETFGRIGPDFFPISGVAAIAYTLFALSLGTAAGALIRRTPLAIGATVIVYGLVAVLMVLAVRPNLAPQTFAVSGVGQATQAGTIAPESWYLGDGDRYAPGSPQARTATESAGAVDAACQKANYNEDPYLTCLEAQHVQLGTFFITSDHYWEMQWKEAAILFGFSIVLLGGSVVAVRRWRA
jgi:hypothetical protein